MQPDQSYTNHRRFHPLFHFFIIPVLSLNVLVAMYHVLVYPGMWEMWWGVLVSVALLGGAFMARYYSLRQQDRIIRLEERLRMERLLPSELKPRAAELSGRQLIALRFCPDEELPGLTRAVLDEGLKTPDAIKRRIGRWRGDYHRI